MVAISTVRSYLAGLQQQLKTDLVAVFVGGTSGIGESTAREIARHTGSPKIYLVGRSQAEADRITSEFKELNSQSQVEFIQSDVSLLRNVDKVCDDIKAREKKINILFMTAGILTMQGRTETTEGLDNKLALHYYSRMRFAQNLLPLLINAASSSSTDQVPIARVVSVLAAGTEGAIITDDLALKNNFSLRLAANHAVTMTTLTMGALAKANPSVAFIHTMPGVVDTNIKRNLGTVMQYAWSGFAVLAKPFMTTVSESGERHAWAATNQEFGSGAHFIGSTGETSINAKLIEKYKSDGTAEKVKEHNAEVFASICNST